LLEVRIETGRTHQIRVHLASVGFPVLGDPVYGPRNRAETGLPRFSRQALHALALGFRHPRDARPLMFRAELPIDMKELLAELRARSPERAAGPGGNLTKPG
jgi:23S rRNA pseudouridine1911/1915/1917 synthase